MLGLRRIRNSYFLVLISLTLLFVALMMATYIINYNHWTRWVTEDLSSLSSSLATSAETYGVDSAEFNSLAQSEPEIDSWIEIYILDSNLNLKAHYGDLQTQSLTSRIKELASSLTGKYIVKSITDSGRIISTDERFVISPDKLLVIRKLQDGNKNNQPQFAAIIYSMADIQQYSYSLFGTYATIYVLAALLIFGLFYYQKRRFAVPLRSMTERLNLAAAGQTTPAKRVLLSSEPDISNMNVAINNIGMTLHERNLELEATHDQFKRFVADTAHYLKNPASVALLETESLLNIQGLPDDIRTRIIKLRRNSEVMDKAINSLNHLNDLDNAQHSNREFEPVAVSDCLMEICNFKAPLAAYKNIAIAVDIAPRVFVLANANYSSLVFDNLVDNAVKYGAAGSIINVSLHLDGDCAAISIRNYGVTILDKDMPHIYKRMHRGGNHQEPGSGLGLAIVKGATELLHWKVSCTSSPSDGTFFRINILNILTLEEVLKLEGFAPDIPVK